MGRRKRRRAKSRKSSLKREKVFLCVPSTGYEHVQLSYYIESELRGSGHDIITSRQVGRPVDYCRNLTISTFMNSPAARTCDWFYTIDSDTIPPQGSLDRLLSWGEKLVCGVTFSVTSGILWMPVMSENPSGSWTPDRGIYQQEAYPLCKIDGIGAACMLVHRSVIESIIEKFGIVFQDRYHEKGNRMLGQDLDFSRKARNLGYDIFCDMELVCDHFKEVNLKEIAISMLEQQKVVRILTQGLQKYFGSTDKAADALFNGTIDLEGLDEFTPVADRDEGQNRLSIVQGRDQKVQVHPGEVPAGLVESGGAGAGVNRVRSVVVQ